MRIIERIAEAVEEQPNVDIKPIDENTRLEEDLVQDMGVDFEALIMYIEDFWDISVDDCDRKPLITVGDLIRMIKSKFE